MYSTKERESYQRRFQKSENESKGQKANTQIENYYETGDHLHFEGPVLSSGPQLLSRHLIPFRVFHYMSRPVLGWTNKESQRRPFCGLANVLRKYQTCGGSERMHGSQVPIGFGCSQARSEI